MKQYIDKQLKDSYNGKLNALFDEWEKSYEANQKHLFCQDGLVVKHKDESSGYDINQKWDESERKIMFIVKDCPDESGWDTRRLFVGYSDNEKSLKNAENARNVKGRGVFFKNIANLLHGLSVVTQENKGISDKFADIDNNKAAQIKAFDEIPFAFVEAKKLAGKKTCSPGKLREALSHDGKYLAAEISILKPNIIVCCDKDEIIFNSVVKNYFNDRIPDEEHRWEYKFIIDGEYQGFDCKLYYYEIEGVLLFSSYHPSSRDAKWIVYEKVLDPFRQFFERYKTFDVVSGQSSDKDRR